MFSKRFVAATAAAVTSLVSFASEPPVSLKVADPAAQVPQTSYTSVLSTYTPVRESNVSPDKVWREANATVASEGMHGEAHGAESPAPQDASGHSGHTMPAQGVNPSASPSRATPAAPAGQASHAGHQMPAPTASPATSNGQPAAAAHTGHQMAPTPKPDPHAGHQMAPAPKPDSHAGHQMAPAPKPDPHAGHQMGQPKKPANAASAAPASGAMNDAAHGQHQQPQEKGTRK